MSSEISVRDQIFSTYDSLYDAEKKGSRLLDQPPIGSNRDVRIGTGPALRGQPGDHREILQEDRLQRGFHQLKIRMAGEQREQEEQVISNEINLDHMEQSLNNILGSKLEELKATYSNFDPKELREIIDKILQADMIEFAAMGNTIPIALDGTYKFNQLGIKAVSSTIWESQEAFSPHSERERYAVCHIGIRSIQTPAQYGGDRKGKSGSHSRHYQSGKVPLAEACDYVLLTATREHIFHDQVSFTRMAAMSVIDCLFLFLFCYKWDSFKNVAEHEQSVAEEKSVIFHKLAE